MRVEIQALQALEILDSRGNPTLSVTVLASNGVTGTAQVPSGASTGKHEATELRDNDPRRYGGKGVLRAVSNVEQVIQPAVLGMHIEDLPAIDLRMCELDGTPGKSRLGANSLLGVSCASARALAALRKEELWKTLASIYPGTRPPAIPVPMVNILSGGLHAGHNIEFQDFLVVPHGLPTYSEAIAAVVQVHRAAREILEQAGYQITGVADEGGWGPLLPSNEAALQILTRAIEHAGFLPGEHLSIALDAASSHFWDGEAYRLHSEARTLTAAGMIDLLDSWRRKYPIVSVEDGLDQDDWPGWKEMTRRLGRSLQLVGDDFLTTNPGLVGRAIQEQAANAVLVKMNQIGTLRETFQVLELAFRGGYGAVVSARSGETEDSFLADLAVASGAGQIKVGSITRSERLAKYNRLLAVEKFDRLPCFKLAIPSD